LFSSSCSAFDFDEFEDDGEHDVPGYQGQSPWLVSIRVSLTKKTGLSPIEKRSEPLYPAGIVFL